MPISRRLSLLLLIVAASGNSARASVPAEEYVFEHENVIGTSLMLRVKATGPAEARAAEARVLNEIDRLSRVFSNHDPSSEFRRWQAAPGETRGISPELFEVLHDCERWSRATSGAFDPRVPVYSKLWKSAERTGVVPSEGELAEARLSATSPAWRLDPARMTALRLPGPPVTLDAIAKGYIVERACEAALAGGPGIRGVLLNVGGDLRVSGDFAPVLGVVAPWADSEAAEPLAQIQVRDAAVATSGRSQRGFQIGGRWYSHVIDPRTGEPAAHVAGATVVAPRSADADALATALNVLTPEEGLRLVATLPGVACLIVAADGRVHRSPRWASNERPIPAENGPKERALDDAKSWADSFELAVSFEINRPEAEAGRYRRPYVAVWVEDEAGVSVRTLLLWVSQGGSGPFQWIPDLRRWFKSDQARKKTDKTELVLTMSRPTRPPGKYSVVWDGKDAKGRPVPPGSYTVYIDAAREHGTYQGMRQPVTLGDAPFTRDIEGNVEIRSATVEYRRRTRPK